MTITSQPPTDLPAATAADPFIKPAEAAEMVGFSVNHLRRLEAAGLFPASTRAGVRGVRRWRRSQILAWLASRGSRPGHVVVRADGPSPEGGAA